MHDESSPPAGSLKCGRRAIAKLGCRADSRVLRTMSNRQNGEELDPEERSELERRLAALRTELEDISRDRLRWPDGAALHLQERSEELEGEADAIRSRLALPAAIGRPSTGTWWGWLALIASAAAAIIGVFMLTR